MQRYLIEKWAEECPDRVYAVFEDGSELTFAELLVRVRAAAAGLQSLGVKQGDHVLLWLPNGRDCLCAWFAINYIGAVCVSINTAYKGGLLEHVVRNSGARVLITLGTLLDRLSAVKLAKLEIVVLESGDGSHIEGLKVLDRDVLERDAEPEPLGRPIEPWDTQCIVYTSGTTGPSKGVLSSYHHMCTMGRNTVSTRDGELLVSRDDRYMVQLPLFHAGGLAPATAMLSIGASISLIRAFDTTRFWQQIEETRTTVVVLLGVMAAYLVKQPVREDEQSTPLRHAICLPLSVESLEFHRRFGVQIGTTFNMTETSCPLISELNPRVVASCGSPRRGIEARIVDEHDYEVPVGATGELIVRSEEPWVLFHGYNENPEATAQALRNGWFHTGDAFRRDAEGNFFFVDRIKDAIRRRGENISSFEVESAAVLHPAVREAAAVGVPCPDSEDDLLVAVSLVEDAQLEPVQLLEFLRDQLAHFMVPRYIRVLKELPKTPTAKVQKFALRAEGVTADTWDREVAGIRVTRERI